MRYPIFTLREERFYPLPVDRRGELIAWVCSGLALSAGGFLWIQAVKLSLLGYAFLMLFPLCAALISFGNWMEANTAITLDPEGIAFSNPIRSLKMDWEMVDSLTVRSTPIGWSVRVSGGGETFQFRTGINLTLQKLSPVKGGFSDGDRIAGVIRGMAGLNPPIRQDGQWVSER